jgi:hypothetical protein
LRLASILSVKEEQGQDALATKEQGQDARATQGDGGSWLSGSNKH